MEDIFNTIHDILNYTLFELGTFKVSIYSVIIPLLLYLVVVYLARKVKKILATRMLSRSQMSPGSIQSTATIVQYLIIVIAVYIIIQNMGINLSSLGTLISALSVGIGFGLQNVVNNFISGIIILFEQPIKEGDRIEVGNILGDVKKIGLRSTHIRDNNNITIIVPNSKFISDNVVNWTVSERLIRFKVPVTIDNDTDIDLLEKLLIEVGNEEPDVLENPPPSVRLMAFGENGMEVELRVWSTSLVNRKGKLTSQINRRIYYKFKDHKISISSPKTDIRIMSYPQEEEENESENEVNSERE